MKLWLAMMLLAFAMTTGPAGAEEIAPSTPTPAPAKTVKAPPEEFAVLVKTLDNPDQEKRFSAFDELTRLAGAAAEDHYLRMLCDSDPLMRARAAQAIGKFKIAAGRPALEYLAATKEEPLWTRRQSVLALGEIADTRSHQVLLVLLSAEAPEISSAAAAALASFPERSTVIALLFVMDNRHGQDLVRRAWRSLQHLGAPAFDIMFEFLQTAEPSRQALYISLLAELRSPAYMRAIEKFLSRGNISSEGKLAVLNMFVLYEYIDGIPAAIGALADRDPAVGHEAFRTLAYLTGVSGEYSRSAQRKALGNSQFLKSLPEETRRLLETPAFPTFEDWKTHNREFLQNSPVETHFAIFLADQCITGRESFNLSQLDWHKWWTANRRTFLQERVRRLAGLARSDAPLNQRAEAIRSLGLLKAGDQFELLWDFFRGEEPILTFESQSALLGIGPDCLDRIGNQLKYENLRTKQRAAMLLGAFHDRRAVTLLVTMIEGQRDLRVLHAACLSLQRITGKTFPAPEAWSLWWRQESGQVKNP